MLTVHMASTDFTADLATVNKLCKGLGASCSPVLSGGARRNLFGAGVENNLAEQLAEQVFELAERSSKDWNFDFVHESPLPGGRYAWERVPEGDVPRWYSLQSSPHKSRNEGKRLFEREKENAPVRRRGSLSEMYNKALLQTSIKGFSKVQKRRSSPRAKSKSSSVLVRGPSLVADYLLDSVGSSQCS